LIVLLQSVIEGIMEGVHNIHRCDLYTTKYGSEDCGSMF